MLFELLTLSGAQVGLDWTAILKRREDIRYSFAGFDAELVAKFTEKQMTLICTEHGLDLAKVHGVVDNAKRILEV
jgi:DNA-3-methyladenine glycosylase I